MKRYVIIRLALVVLNVFLLATFLFFALTFANFNKWANITPIQVSPMVWRIYKVYIWNALVQGDWGLMVNGDSVLEIVVPRFWISLRYNILALFLYVPLGISIGAISAYLKGGIFDRIVNSVTLIFGSIPTYILAFLLIIVLGYNLQWFPPHFSQIPSTFWGRIWGLGIPMIALSAGAISKISRVVRSEMIESLDSEFFLLARVKGLTSKQAYIRHLLKNSIVPVLPVMVEVFMLVLMGSFFVEMSFGIEGVAEILYKAIVHIEPNFRISYVLIDVNTIVVISTYYMLVGYLFSLGIDIMYYVIDPRIRIHE